MEPMSGQKPPEKFSHAQLKQLFMQCANEHLVQAENKRFEVYDKEQLNGLFLYFIESEESPYSLHKGLWLDGSIGTGKQR